MCSELYLFFLEIEEKGDAILCLHLLYTYIFCLHLFVKI